MFLNGHHIIQFAMKRFGLTKKKIELDFLGCARGTLSRQEPPTIDVNKYYKKLFNVKQKGSAAQINSESDDALLGGFRDYLIKADCIREANYINSSIKKATEKKAGVNYEKIWKELLRRAQTQPLVPQSLPIQQPPEQPEQDKADNTSLNSIDSSISQDEDQPVHELTLPEQPIFSKKTIKSMKNHNPSKANELFKSLHDDLTRPLTPIKKEE